MKKIKLFIRQHSIPTPGIAILILVVSVLSVSFIAHSNNHQESKKVLAAKTQISPTPSNVPTDSPTFQSQPAVFMSSQMTPKQQLPTATPVPNQSLSTQTTSQSQVTSQSDTAQSQPVSTPTTVPTIVLPTATPTSIPVPTSQPTVPAQTVTMQVVEPDGTKNFQVILHSGDNLCDNLTEAKNEGKIKSVTLSNAWMSSFHSLYVVEIDGYSNNWTMSVNGISPSVGCSLINPKPNDTITWTFG